ncbi:MAG: 1-(5-phosphoribosyl)-5-[(5-phosphoribosylamino)methylideneamino] imidazole-4-carboxamide isomerase [Acidobacteriota bacterium]
MIKIPAIDLIDGACVRLYRGDYARQTTYTLNPVEQALRFQSAGFRRIHVIDLEGARDGSGKNRHVQEPVVVDRWVARWGGDRFIVSLDLRQGALQTHGWTAGSEITVAALVERIRQWGMKEMISTDVDRDGTLERPNYGTYQRLIELGHGEVGVIAAGGVSRPEHIRQLAHQGVDGVVIGRALYEGDFTWEDMLRAG